MMLKTYFIIFAVNILYFISPPAFANEDPCNQVPGKWHGKLVQVYNGSLVCNWDVKATGSQYETVVAFNLSLYNGSSPTGTKCYDSSISLSGQCNNAQLTLDGPYDIHLTGTIIDNKINVNGGNTSAKIGIQLRK